MEQTFVKADTLLTSKMNLSSNVCCGDPTHKHAGLTSKILNVCQAVLVHSPHEIISTAGKTGTTHDGSGTKAETYSSISATNQHQSRQKIYQ